MSKYSVLLVNGETEQKFKFEHYYKGFEDFEFIIQEPPHNISDLINYIVTSNIAAVISEFNLQENNPNILYYGNDVIHELLKVKPNFPVFIFTSYEAEALDSVESVHYVYSKQLMNDKNHKFLKLVKKEIDKYQYRIEQAQKEFSELKLKSLEQDLGVSEEKRLLDLDDFLEKTIDQKKAIPTQMKGKYIDKLSEVLKKTDELIEKVTQQHKK